jgi:hypothetical protein
MIKNKMALLGAVTTLGMMGAVLASPAGCDLHMIPSQIREILA